MFDPMGQEGGFSAPGEISQQFGQEVPPTEDDMGMMTDFQADENQFDADFDAGVEADEETDPKRFIQQLTGKLSQSLRKYNEDLPQPDADLNKYVSGMVVKQCLEGLSQEDVKDIMSKIKSDESEDNEQDEQKPLDNEQPEMEQFDDEGGVDTVQMNESESVRQSVSDRYKSFTGDNDRRNDDKTVPDRNTYHKRPFVGKTFKS